MSFDWSHWIEILFVLFYSIFVYFIWFFYKAKNTQSKGIHQPSNAIIINNNNRISTHKVLWEQNDRDAWRQTKRGSRVHLHFNQNNFQRDDSDSKPRVYRLFWWIGIGHSIDRKGSESSSVEKDSRHETTNFFSSVVYSKGIKKGQNFFWFEKERKRKK